MRFGELLNRKRAMAITERLERVAVGRFRALGDPLASQPLCARLFDGDHGTCDVGATRNGVGDLGQRIACVFLRAIPLAGLPSLPSGRINPGLSDDFVPNRTAL